MVSSSKWANYSSQAANAALIDVAADIMGISIGNWGRTLVSAEIAEASRDASYFGEEITELVWSLLTYGIRGGIHADLKV